MYGLDLKLQDLRSLVEKISQHKDSPEDHESR